MIVMPITYTNPITDEELTKSFYFGLTRVEALRLNAEWARWGGLEGRYDALVESGGDVKFIMETIEELILRSYGVRVGDEIEKSTSLRDQFKSSEAYSTLFVNLLQNDDPQWDPNEFIKGIVPKGLRLSDVNTAEPNPSASSQTARQASEARMQGHRKQQKKQRPAQRVDELEIRTQDVPEQQTRRVDPEDYIAPDADDFDDDQPETIEQKRARLQRELENLQ